MYQIIYEIDQMTSLFLWRLNCQFFKELYPFHFIIFFNFQREIFFNFQRELFFFNFCSDSENIKTIDSNTIQIAETSVYI